MAPNEFQGSVIGGINKRSGIIQNTDMSDDGSGCVIQADVPLAQVKLIEEQIHELLLDGAACVPDLCRMLKVSTLCCVHGAIGSISSVAESSSRAASLVS